MFSSRKMWGKMQEKKKGKKKWKEIKNRVKINKLFLYANSNSFHFFFSLIYKD